jgi:hypothetical protein
MSSTTKQERSLSIISGLFFATTAWWVLRKLREENERKLRNSRSLPFDDTGVPVPGGNVAKRCKRALSPAIPYLEAFLMGLSYPCNQDNPDGYVPFCVAENKLAIDILSERLMQAKTATQTFSDETVYCYNSFLGLPVARQAAAYFIAKRFLFPNVPTISADQALASINPNHIGISSGAAGILNSLFFLLGDKGDACLIPAPYYAAFDSDMSLVANIVPFAFHLSNPTLGPTESELDLAFMEARSVSILLVQHRLILCNYHLIEFFGCLFETFAARTQSKISAFDKP